MNNKIEARQQKTEESELKEKDEMERTGEFGGACGIKLEQREIYEALVEDKALLLSRSLLSPQS